MKSEVGWLGGEMDHPSAALWIKMGAQGRQAFAVPVKPVIVQTLVLVSRSVGHRPPPYIFATLIMMSACLLLV